MATMMGWQKKMMAGSGGAVELKPGAWPNANAVLHLSAFVEFFRVSRVSGLCPSFCGYGHGIAFSRVFYRLVPFFVPSARLSLRFPGPGRFPGGDGRPRPMAPGPSGFRTATATVWRLKEGRGKIQDQRWDKWLVGRPCRGGRGGVRPGGGISGGCVFLYPEVKRTEKTVNQTGEEMKAFVISKHLERVTGRAWCGDPEWLTPPRRFRACVAVGSRTSNQNGCALLKYFATGCKDWLILCGLRF